MTYFRLAQEVVDWAEGDPAKGNVIAGSPLAVALVWRATARWSLGLSGWPEDLRDAVTMARAADPATHAMVIGVKYAATAQGVLRTDDDAVTELGEALRIAEGLSDDTALGSLRFGAGSAFIYHPDAAVRRQGLDLLETVSRNVFTGKVFRVGTPARRGMHRARDRPTRRPGHRPLDPAAKHRHSGVERTAGVCRCRDGISGREIVEPWGT